ncbi:hypothetical protein I7I48_11324 [Histoplasma ohiense]|nr:hypothetical protein I7I48_11324 [Histoplasma ohiense (nom. inval.)]
MCSQYYNLHSCGHSVFVRTRTCGLKQFCPLIKKEPIETNYMCERCAAHILLAMKRDLTGRSNRKPSSRSPRHASRSPSR